MKAKKRPEESLSIPERVILALAELQSQPDSKSAHFFRTSFRRLKTLLENTSSIALSKRRQQTLKYMEKILSAAGKLRDTALHLKMLDEVAGADQDQQKLAKMLKKRYDKREQRVQSVFKDRELKNALELLADLSFRSGLAGEQKSAQERQRLLQTVLGDYARFAAQRPPLTFENLHEYRLTTKTFRYRAELAGEDIAGPVVRSFKEIQDAIGDWHDWDLLSELAEKKLKKGSALLLNIQRTRDKMLAQAIEKVELNEGRLLRQTPKDERKPVQRAGPAASGHKAAV